MSSPSARDNPAAEDPVHKLIGDLITSILHDLMESNGRPSITIKRRYQRGGTFHINLHDDGRGALEPITTEAETHITYSWPGKTAYEAWKFSALLRAISLIHGAIMDDSVITKRDIYYNDPVLFGSQGVVDTLVDDLAYTIGVDRASLHVTSVAKGLTAGHYLLTTKVQTLLDGSSSSEDVLIPRLEDIDSIDISEANWVLVVEKEAVLRRLVKKRYHMNCAAGKGILITGKGYPDLCTRAFVHLLFETTLRDANPHSRLDGVATSSSTLLRPPPRFYALVDSDPDGMAIMSTYKYGSKAHAHESARLNAPNLQWLGVRISDVVAGAGALGGEDDPLIPLTSRDRKKAQAMLRDSPAFAEDGPEMEWRAELQTMLMLNLKAETEILYERQGGLEGWLDRKMV